MADQGRRIAVIPLSPVHLAQIFGLPPDVHVIGVRDDFISMSVYVMVEGKGLDEVPPGVQAPILDWTYEWDEQGQRMYFARPTTP